MASTVSRLRPEPAGPLSHIMGGGCVPRYMYCKLKARGDMQVLGVDYFDTYEAVAQWSTIRMMMILSIDRSQ